MNRQAATHRPGCDGHRSAKGARMTVTRRAVLAGAASLPLIGVARRASAQAEITLNAVHFTPAQVSYAKSFLKYVDKVNQVGKGIVQIKVRGGPEVMPFAQTRRGAEERPGRHGQLPRRAVSEHGARRRGVLGDDKQAVGIARQRRLRADQRDLREEGQCASCSPTSTAAPGSTSSRSTSRCAPPTAGSTSRRLKIRSAALYRDFLESLGAGVVVQSPGEIYTSLERGLVNANCLHGARLPELRLEQVHPLPHRPRLLPDRRADDREQGQLGQPPAPRRARCCRTSRSSTSARATTANLESARASRASRWSPPA